MLSLSKYTSLQPSTLLPSSARSTLVLGRRWPQGVIGGRSEGRRGRKKGLVILNRLPFYNGM